MPVAHGPIHRLSRLPGPVLEAEREQQPRFGRRLVQLPGGSVLSVLQSELDSLVYRRVSSRHETNGTGPGICSGQEKCVGSRQRRVGPVSPNSCCRLLLPHFFAYCWLSKYFNGVVRRSFGCYLTLSRCHSQFLVDFSTRSCIATNRQEEDHFHRLVHRAYWIEEYRKLYGRASPGVRLDVWSELEATNQLPTIRVDSETGALRGGPRKRTHIPGSGDLNQLPLRSAAGGMLHYQCPWAQRRGHQLPRDCIIKPVDSRPVKMQVAARYLAGPGSSSGDDFIGLRDGICVLARRRVVVSPIGGLKLRRPLVATR